MVLKPLLLAITVLLLFTHAFIPYNHHRTPSPNAAARQRLGPLRDSSAPETVAAGLQPLLSEGIQVKQVEGIEAGRILVAKPWEYNHFTSKSCLFIYRHDAETGSRAVVLERPTAFTLEELAPPFEKSQFAHHTVFLGGEQGGDMAVLLHPYPQDTCRTQGLHSQSQQGRDMAVLLRPYPQTPGAHSQGGDMAVLLHPYPQIPGARSVGGGLYYGGLKSAEAMLREQSEEGVEHGLSLNQFKWWFNYMSWGPGQLESQIENGSWDILEANAQAVLRQGPVLERDLWVTLRRHYLPKEENYDGEEEELQ